MPLLECRNAPRAAPPLQGDDVEPLAFEAAHHFARPCLGGARGALRFRHERLWAQQRMTRAEERIGVSHALVRAA